VTKCGQTVVQNIPPQIRSIKRRSESLSILLVALSVSVASIPLSASSPSGGPESAQEMEFQGAMRKLREDHITWTHVFIISAAADLPDKDAATDRLLQNQVDMGKCD
jgi:hypothetical protein